MKVSVVPELMSFLRDAADNLGPTLGMSTEHEERCTHPLTPEHVEDGRRRARIRAVIERDADRVLALRQVCENGTEHRAVAVPGPVGREAGRDDRGHCGDHMRTATRPMTA